ncbi:hypothetical protein GDO81_001498 [Engystomops pustulosus]|uniref:Secreted protein n=1 Tax=Engystomops pustulosus TaxID=76066 RepID=A0AAV7DCW0_ENGPU|nr:hypothetical protein GDO81_001498 [Engystomops pustulosus]
MCSLFRSPLISGTALPRVLMLVHTASIRSQGRAGETSSGDHFPYVLPAAQPPTLIDLLVSVSHNPGLCWYYRWIFLLLQAV